MTVPSQARPKICHTSSAANPDAQTAHIPLTDTQLAEIEARVNADVADTRCGEVVTAAHKTSRRLLSEVRRGRERESVLREALTEARKDILAAHYAGWDSERKLSAESAVTRIDRALAATETP